MPIAASGRVRRRDVKQRSDVNRLVDRPLPISAAHSGLRALLLLGATRLAARAVSCSALWQPGGRKSRSLELPTPPRRLPPSRAFVCDVLPPPPTPISSRRRTGSPALPRRRLRRPHADQSKSIAHLEASLCAIARQHHSHPRRSHPRRHPLEGVSLRTLPSTWRGQAIPLLTSLVCLELPSSTCLATTCT